MDEPTEGLAPVIVAQVEEMLVRLGEDGDMSVLVIEQNIGVATAVSKQRRDHGQWPDQPHHRLRAPVGRPRAAAAAARRRPSRPCTTTDAGAAADAGIEARRGRAQPAPRDGADPHLCLQSRAADALVAAGAASRASRPPRATLSTGVTRIEDGRPATARSRCYGTDAHPGPPVVLVAGTLDTKGDGTALHPRRDRGQGLRDAAGRRIDQRQALQLRRLRAGNRA